MCTWVARTRASAPILMGFILLLVLGPHESSAQPAARGSLRGSVPGSIPIRFALQGQQGGLYTLNAAPGVVAPGDSITVSWTTPDGLNSSNDLIGLGRAIDPDSLSGAFYSGVFETMPTGGAQSGSITFTAPDLPPAPPLFTEGYYQFHFIPGWGNGGSIVDSNLVQVTTGGATPAPGIAPAKLLGAQSASPSNPTGGGSSGGGSSCGLTGLETVLVLGLLALRKRPA